VTHRIMLEPDEITREPDGILGLFTDDAEARMALADGFAEPDEEDSDPDEEDSDEDGFEGEN